MTESRLLAIETSSPTGSIALKYGDNVADRTIATPREQTPRILAIVDELLREAELKLADLDAIVFGRGPGSFTGLRVAAAVAQGLSFSSGVPIVSVSSLAVLAQRGFGASDASQASPDAELPSDSGALAADVLCCIDARMGEVYWASFCLVDGRAQAESDERIGSPESVAPLEAPFVALGDGFAAYPEALANVIEAATSVDPTIVPTARALLTLGAAEVAAARFVPLEAALPVYLRNSDAWQKS